MIGIVLLLLVSRIQQIGLKDILIDTTPYFKIGFGNYGQVRISASLVFQLLQILTTELKFTFQTLYIPFIMPFIIMSILTLIIFKKVKSFSKIFKHSWNRLGHAASALFGALTLVELMTIGGTGSPAYIIGNNISNTVGNGWIVISPFIGSLGSFFAGSTTVSNLTFGYIQKIASQNIDYSLTHMLSLQAVGASIGTSICIFHVIAISTVISDEGVNIGDVIKRLALYVLLADLIAVAVIQIVTVF
jgi:lactate permease